MSSSSSSISLDDFVVLKLIGKGHSGQVFLALDRASQAPVALKVIKKGQGHDQRVVAEQRIQRSISGCTFVLPLLCSWQDTLNFYLVTEYMGGHDLAINIALAGRYDENTVRFYASELVIALEYLKAHKILHRDIKPGNIVLSPKGHIRVLDFGYSTVLKPCDIIFTADPLATSGRFRLPDPDYTTCERVGTPMFMSMDALVGNPYSFEADLHSLGVTIYKMLTGRMPFGEAASTYEDIYEAVLCDPVQFEQFDNVSVEAEDLVRKLLARDYRNITTIEEVLNHPFFAGVRWDRVRAQAASPPSKPFVSSLPKKPSTIIIEKGSPCLTDHSEFFFICPEFEARRTSSRPNLFQKFFGAGKASFSGITVIPTPVVPLLVSSPPSPLQLSAATSPPTPAPAPAPASSPSTPTLSPSTPARPVLLPIVGITQLPFEVRTKLAMRAPPPVKARPIRGDMTTMPTLTVTPAEDDIQPIGDSPSPAPRTALGDVTNVRLLSPIDAERPTWTAPVARGPIIKLSAPPKRRRANKENAPPPKPVNTKPTRSPPTAVFMVPPKPIKKLITIAPTPPTPVATKASLKLLTEPGSPPKQPLPQPPLKAKGKPAFKVPATVVEKRGTPISRRESRGAVHSLKTPAVKASPPQLNSNNSFPRRMDQAKVIEHPALKFARAKEKPAAYPRPQFKEPPVASVEVPVVVQPLSVAEAFAVPPASSDVTANNSNSQFIFTSAPQACGVLTASSPAFSLETKAGFYGLFNPRINLDPVKLKCTTDAIVARARAKAMENAQGGLFASARSTSPPISVGPHYGGYLPGPSPTGFGHDLRRFWIRMDLVIRGFLSRIWNCRKPDVNELRI